jgi:fructose-1,6-bisphosphatase/inositol monophosphatase family enzyme
MKTFYTQVKRIVDNSLKNRIFKKIKKDNSMLTINDLKIQKEIINLIKKKFPEVKQFICEENFNINNYHNIDFKKPFAIIDPIDGTENFFAQNEMFGTLISINYKSSLKVDLIYIPSCKLMITRDNILKICNKAKKNNNISLLSTKCLANKNYKGSNYRIFGSAAYSFYKFIVGEVNEYIYCDGAKIWDCFTGLRLSSLINCKIQVKQKKWINKPTFKTEFKLKWI